MSCLPDDIWFYIARYHLNNFQDLSSFVFSCKRFHSIFLAMKDNKLKEIRKAMQIEKENKKIQWAENMIRTSDYQWYNQEAFDDELSEERYFSAW